MKKNNKNQGLFTLIKMYFKLHPVLLSLVIVLLLIFSVSQSVTGLAIKPITDGAQQVIKGSITMDVYKAQTLYPWCIALVVIGALGVVCSLANTLIMGYVGQDFMDYLRKKAFAHMESLPLSFFAKNQKGDIMSVFTNDIDLVRQFLIQTLQTVITSIATIAVLFVSMLLYSLYLTLIALVASCVMAYASISLGKKSASTFKKLQDIIGKQEGFTEEMMSGLKVVKSFNHEEKAKEKFDVINKEFQDVGIIAHTFSNKMGPALSNIGYIAYVLVVLVGSLMIGFNAYNYGFQDGVAVMSLGTMIAFIPLVQQTTSTVQQIGQQATFIAQAQAGANRVFDLLNEKSEVDDGYVEIVQGTWVDENTFVENKNPKHTDSWAWKHPHKNDGTVSYVPLKGDIKMFNVDFAYEPGKIVLHDISLYAKPGQKVAFVGATGAGKTTVTNLLNRFYDLADGKIRYDDININKIKKKDLRTSLGVVLQDTSLFSGTIMDNIRFGRLDATDEECIEAAKLVNADSFIRMLPDGYNTYIEGDGSTLSQGQCQLLSIARVAVADPPVLILDEATSSIDTRTEALVMDGMDKLMEGRTVFAIAHRLSTVMNSNVIMVLDHGRIIERGTHEQLLENKGLYYQLYTGTTELE